MALPVPLHAAGGAHGGHWHHPPCPKDLGPLVLPIPDPRHPGLVFHVRIRPLVRDAHQLSKESLVLCTPSSMCLCVCSFSLSLCALSCRGKNAFSMAWIVVLGWQFRQPLTPTSSCPTPTPVVHPQMCDAPSSRRACPCPCPCVLGLGANLARRADIVGALVCCKAFVSIFWMLALPSLLRADLRHLPSLVAVLVLAAGPQHVPSPVALPLPLPLLHTPTAQAIVLLV